MLCILVFASLYYLVCSSKQIYFFVLQFMFALFLLVSFCSFLLPNFGNVCLSKIIFFGGLSTTVRSFCILQFHFSIHSFQKLSRLVDNSSPGIERYLKISIAYVFYKPPHPTLPSSSSSFSQTPRLDWSSLLRLRFVIGYSPTPPTSNPFVSAPPIIKITLHLSSTP